MFFNCHSKANKGIHKKNIDSFYTFARICIPVLICTLI